MRINVDEVRASLEARSTDELVEMVSLHDEKAWQPDVFDLAKSILLSRGLFPQDIARVAHGMREQAEPSRSGVWHPAGAPPDYTRVADGVWLEAAESISECLTAAGIPFCFVEKYRHGLDCYVPAEQGKTARRFLEENSLIPEQPTDEGTDNFCPKCGTELPNGASECPACEAAFS